MLERHPTRFKSYKRTWLFRSRVIPGLVTIPITLLMLDLIGIRRPAPGPEMFFDIVISFIAIGLSFAAGYARFMVHLCDQTEKAQALKERKPSEEREAGSTSSPDTSRQ